MLIFDLEKMPDQPVPYSSYLVRFWWEDKGREPEGAWRGEVESVQTGHKWQFHHLSGMLQFIQAQMETHVSDFSVSDQLLDDSIILIDQSEKGETSC